LVGELLEKKEYYFNTPNIFTLTFWSLPDTFIGRSLFSSSGSCHDSDVKWQDFSRMCGSECSCPRPSSTFVRFSPENRDKSTRWIKEAEHIRKEGRQSWNWDEGTTLSHTY